MLHYFQRVSYHGDIDLYFATDQMKTPHCQSLAHKNNCAFYIHLIVYLGFGNGYSFFFLSFENKNFLSNRHGRQTETLISTHKHHIHINSATWCKRF